MKRPFFAGLLFLSACAGIAFAKITALPDAVTPAIADRQAFVQPDAIHLSGWVGSRVTASEANRLARIDTARLLEGYRQRPGRQSWDGEHIGKWIHAATLAWVYTGDQALRAKLDAAVTELMKCQLEDGYLGTYLPKDRWTEWDVWAHKYNLIGLITYMRYTRNTAPLTTCRRMADLLCRELGDGPGQRSILVAGTQHYGMASTSVLEPMVLLYRLTGEPRYLAFCQYITRAWEQPKGPLLFTHLLGGDGVNRVGNGKGYEMLSCLNGALELYRTTGEPRLLQLALNAWQDIVANRLYLTGAATAEECFHQDFNLPNVRNVGETCVTVTWLQLNAQLLRLTGEARFAEQLERVVLNQLFGAQRPDGAAWGYYVQMEGTKPYSDTLDGHCCLSSGPRGVALIPSFAVSSDAAGVVVNLYDAGIAHLALTAGGTVEVNTTTLYPAEGIVRITINPSSASRFTVKLRLPDWCEHYAVTIGSEPANPVKGADGYLSLERGWQRGDVIQLQMDLPTRIVQGDHMNAGRVAVLYGPLVLAADTGLLNQPQAGISSVTLPSAAPSGWKVVPAPAPAGYQSWPGSRVYHLRRTDGTDFDLPLVPFADAGSGGGTYRVWLPVTQAGGDHNLLLGGREARSNPLWDHARYDGSMLDRDPATVFDTFDRTKPAEVWFATTLLEPVTLHRLVFVHGHNDADGGWFDTAGGKPRVQVKATATAEWTTVGDLAAYPDTTAISAGSLKPGERIEFTFPSPLPVVAVRVIGQPAAGNDPKQAFASCAELEAY